MNPWTVVSLVLYALGFVLCLGTLRSKPPPSPLALDLLWSSVWPGAVTIACFVALVVSPVRLVVRTLRARR